MTDKTEAQPEALRLAAWLKEGAWHQMRLGDVEAAGRELRRQHAEIQQLKAQLSARQAALDGWRIALERIADPRNTHFAGDAQIVARDALSAAPPPSEREPLNADDLREPKNGKAWRVEWWNESLRMMLPSQMRLDRVQAFKTGTLVLTLKKSVNAHGIGATND